MSKEKLAVTIWNYKGGVGKSTISLILSQIAAQNNLKVLAIDLDEQKNLAETLKLSQSLFNSIEVRTELKDDFADEDFNFYVIDTHPSKDETITKALKFADIVLVPVLGDYNSIINLRSVWEYIYNAVVGSEQTAIIKNCMTDSKLSNEVEAVLDEHKYSVAGRLPRSNILLKNIASGDCWDKYMRKNQRRQFIELYKKIWHAYREMLKGNFHNLWK